MFHNTYLGCWPPITEKISVVAIDVSVHKKLIAAAYDNGDVSIFNYPCQNFGVTRKITFLTIS